MGSNIVILGGGIAGCMAAARARQSGLHPVVIERRPFLGFEMAGRYQLYIRHEEACAGKYKELLPIEGGLQGDTRCYFQGEIKAGLVGLLKEQGIPFFLNMHPAGLLTDGDNQVTGMLLACSYGVYRLDAAAVMDCTGENVVQRMLNGDGKACKSAPVGFTAEVENLPGADRCIRLSAAGRWDGRVYVNRSRRPEAALITFFIEGTSDAAEPYKRTNLELCARQTLCEIVKQLKQRPEYRAFRLLHLAYEASFTNEASDVTGWKGIYACPSALQPGFTDLDLDLLADGLRCEMETIQVPLCAGRAATGLHINGETAAVEQVLWREKGLIRWMDTILHEVRIDGAILPSISADTSVAGLGTSGICAYFGADKGTDVLGIEPHYTLGGTRTVGDIMPFYHGYLGGYTETLNERLLAFEKTDLGFEDEECTVTDPNAYMLMLNDEVTRANGRVLMGSVVCGTYVRAGALKGLLVANASGMFVIDTKLTIDATGNADVAALAGCETLMGDPDDGMTQTFSMAGSTFPGEEGLHKSCYGGDFDTVDTSSYEDMMRALVLGLQDNSPYYVVNQVAYREGRRIVGETYVTLEQSLAQIAVEQPFAVVKSTIDCHGRVSSELGRMGFAACEEEYRFALPMGCFIPKGMGGLLVGGKSISVDRDVLCMARMNADVQNAGYALGIAARKTSREHGKFSYSTIAPLLVQEGLLPDDYMPSGRTDDNDIIEALCEEDPFSLMRVIIHPKERMLPLLREKYGKSDSEKKRLLYAKAMAWYGDAAGRGLLYDRMNWLAIHEDTTPMSDVDRRTDHVKHGIQGRLNDYWEQNQLILLSSHIMDRRFEDLICNLLCSCTAGGSPKVSKTDVYFAARNDMICIPYYDRISNLIYAVLRNPDKAFGKPLLSLLSKKNIAGGYYAHAVEELPLFYSSYLELMLAKALYMCGQSEGGEILMKYKSDVRSILRKEAGKVLEEL